MDGSVLGSKSGNVRSPVQPEGAQGCANAHASVHGDVLGKNLSGNTQ